MDRSRAESDSRLPHWVTARVHAVCGWSNLNRLKSGTKLLVASSEFLRCSDRVYGLLHPQLINVRFWLSCMMERGQGTLAGQSKREKPVRLCSVQLVLSS